MKDEIDVNDFVVIEHMKRGDDDTKVVCIKRNKLNLKDYVATSGTLKPYFYIKEEESIEPIKNFVFDMSIGFVDMYGNKVKKIEFNTLKNMRTCRELFQKTYESDVPYIQRFIIDNNIKFDRNKRIMYIDIETDMSVDISAPQPVISICTYDNMTKKYYTFIFRNDFECKTINKSDNHIIYKFNDERNMLLAFIKSLHENYPDIITGWNVEGFDIPYLMNRLKKLNIDVRKMSRLDVAYVAEATRTITKDGDRKYEKFVERGRIYGLEILDLLLLYRRIVYRRPPDYSLDTVARVLFGKDFGKTEKGDPHTRIHNLWVGDESEVDRLIEYNKHDVEMSWKIDERKGLTNYFITIQGFVPVSLDSVFMVSRVIDTYILKRFHNEIVFPSKPKRDDDGNILRENEDGTLEAETDTSLIGGYTAKPIPGLHRWTALYDVKSMYPSIYRTFNISPDTLQEKASEQTVSVNNIHFLRPEFKSGIIPTVITELMEVRYELQKKRGEHEHNSPMWDKFNELQDKVKELCNSLYGVMSYPGFRLYDMRIANSITYVGREAIKYMRMKIEELGCTAIYSDTDSVYVGLNKEFKDEKEAYEFASSLQKIINGYFDDFVAQFGLKKHYLKMEFAKMFDKIIFTEAKKRYAGHVVWEDEKFTTELYCRGLDTVRKDMPLDVRDELQKIIAMILEEKTYPQIMQYIKEVKEKVMKMPIWEIAAPRTISFDEYKGIPQHIRAARYSNKYLGTNFDKNNPGRILFVKKLPEHCPKYYEGEEDFGNFVDKRVDIIMISSAMDLKGIEIDYDRFMNKIVLQKLRSLFEVMHFPLISDEGSVSMPGVQKQLFDYKKQKIWSGFNDN